MMTPIDPNRLLDDTLAGDENFRATSLETTLRAVRQRRRTRQRRRVLLALAAVLVAGALGVFHASQRGPVIGPQFSAKSSPSGGISFVTTKPLPAEAVVATRLGIVERIASEPNNVPRVLKGDTATPALNIDDAGLFMLLAGHSVAIIRPPGARAELLLLDAATDQ